MKQTVLFFISCCCAVTTSQAQWIKLNTQPYAKVQMSDVYARGNRIVAVGTYTDFSFAQFRGYAFTSADGGTTWDSTIGPGLFFKTVAFKDADTGYIGGYGLHSVIIKTNNGGLTWDSYQEDTSTGGVRDMKFFDDKTGIACGYDNPQLFSGHFYKTLDGGTTWADVHSDDTLTFDRMQFVDENNGYVIGNLFLATHILRTTDGGVNWKLVHNHNGYPSDIHFWNASTGILCDITGNIYKTIDSGVTWTKTHNIYNINALRGITFINAQTGFCVGDNGIILKSTDGGENWIKQTSPTKEALYHVEYYNDYLYAVGSNGTIIRTQNVMSVQDVPVAEKFILYPNPAGNLLHISGTQAVEKVQVYDAKGNLVLSGNTTDSDDTINISNLDAGIYMAVINHRQPVKFIKT